MKKNTKEAIATLTYFPEEIIKEIFLKLPGRPLLRFRCVGKFICTLIDTPSFRSMNHDLSNCRDNPSLMFCEAEHNKIYTIDYKSVSSLLPFPLPTSSSTNCQFTTNHMNYPLIFQDCEVDFLSSCDGLVWFRLSKNGDTEFYVWNPSTRVYKTITLPEVNIQGEECGYGFCYDHKTGDYKLVYVVVDQASRSSHVHVYTLSSNSWKTTQSIPYHLYYDGYRGVIFYGALQWLVRTFELNSAVLLRFDTVNEKFEEVALPETPMPYPEEPLEANMFDIHVGVLGGCLCLVFRRNNVRVDVWVMQKYGVRESWTKSFSITNKLITCSRYLELIWSFKNNEILWEIDRFLILYDPNNKTHRTMAFDSHYSERLTAARNYMASSVSL